jgi:adenylylsulfate reductase subunit A
MVVRKDELNNWAPYGLAKPIPANLRTYLGMLDVEAGLGPLYMETAEAIQNIANQYKDDQKAFKKKMKELESEAWEDFLDMTISQAILWAASNIMPEESRSEIAACEPYFIGSHSGASGAWVSGPEDLDTPYKWGYGNMCTVKGLFACGDASGASSHKFSSGSHAEGRFTAKEAVRYCVENTAMPNYDAAALEALKKTILQPLDTYAAHCKMTTAPEINPNYIKPMNYMWRLQKMMDEYAGGWGSGFKTSKSLLERGLQLMAMLKEDSLKLGAANVYDLERCWENVQRTWQAEAHMRTLLFRDETRWPGYYFRADTPKMDEKNWHAFANCKWDPKTGEWEMIKRDVVALIP